MSKILTKLAAIWIVFWQKWGWFPNYLIIDGKIGIITPETRWWKNGKRVYPRKVKK